MGFEVGDGDGAKGKKQKGIVVVVVVVVPWILIGVVSPSAGGLPALRFHSGAPLAIRHHYCCC